MKASDCRFVEENIWRYVDRELSARQVGEISLHLRACASCSRLYELRAKESALYRAAFTETPFGDRFAARFQERLLEESGGEARGGRGAADDAFTFSPTVSHRRWAVAISVAAMALVAVLGFLLRPGGGRIEGPESGDGSLGVFRGADRGIEVTRSGGEPFHGGDILPGDRYRLLDARQEVQLDLRDGSRIAFGGGPGEFIIGAASRPHGAFSGMLRAGRIEAEVSPRDRGQVFEILTPNAIVRVVGTRFLLAVEESEAGMRTELTVQEGTVRLLDAATGSDTLVSALDGPRRVITAAVVERPVEPLTPDPDPALDPASDPAPEPADPAPVTGPSSTLDQPASSKDLRRPDGSKR